MEKYSKGENVFNVFNIICMVFLCILTVYPFLHAFAVSLSSDIAIASKVITIFPIDINLENYILCLGREDIKSAAVISVLRTVSGIILHLFITGLAAYGISVKTLPLKKAIGVFFVIPMFLNAGLIPYYVTIHDLKLMNTFWVYVIPGAFATYHMLVMRTYFETIPDSLIESARIDGANEVVILGRIIAPLSLPVIAVVALFVGVGQWNSWFDAMLFVTDVKLHPLAMVLQRVIMASEIRDPKTAMSVAKKGALTSPEGIKMAVLMIVTLPIIFSYPFFQRYFIRGIMIGAVKG